MPFFVPFCLRSPKPTEARKKKYSKKKPSVNNTRLPLRKRSECFVPLYLRAFPSGDRLHPVAGDAGGSPARAGGGGGWEGQGVRSGWRPVRWRKGDGDPGAGKTGPTTTTTTTTAHAITWMDLRLLRLRLLLLPPASALCR